MGEEVSCVMSDKNFDPAEAIMILVGVVLVGGCIIIGCLFAIAQSLPHTGGQF